VHCEATQFVVATTNHNKVGLHTVLSDWLQPQQNGSLHSALSSQETKSDEMIRVICTLL